LKSGCFDGLNGLNISQLMVEQLFFERCGDFDDFDD
jgi:hypothetical protein